MQCDVSYSWCLASRDMEKVLKVKAQIDTIWKGDMPIGVLMKEQEN